jgi:desampylase
MDEWAVAASVIEGITAHALRARPHECCGLLIGADGTVAAFHAARNTAPQPCTRYTIDPVDHFAAIRRARLAGLDVVGAYHSHPATAAVPSATDRAEAFPHFLFVIVSLATQPPVVEGWHLVDGNFAPTRLVRTG